jgi:hypothetical protein
MPANRHVVACLFCLVWTIAGGAATQVHASLVAYESFAYANGNLLNNNGGFGQWGSAWEMVESRATTVNNGVAVLGLLNNTDSGTIRRRFTTNLDSLGSTTWIRWSGQYTRTGSPLGATGGLSLIDENNTERLRIGKFSGSDVWGVSQGITVADSNVAITNPADMWVRIQHSAGNDSIRFWVNPGDISTEAALDGGSFVDLNDVDVSGIFGVRLAAAAGTNTLGVSTQTWTFDNLRVGTTFGAMSAVPEPGSGWLLAGAVACLAGRRRRRA